MKKKLLFSLLAICITGNVLIAQNEVTAPDVIKKRAFKFEFFSPTYGTLNFGYEQSISKRINIDVGAGIIGVGFNETATASSGMFVRGGARLYFSPDYYTDDLRYYSDFQGSYFRPELIMSFFNFDFTDELGSDVIGNNASMGIQLNFGKQWAIANTVPLDLWLGIGYNINFTEDSDEMPFKYGYVGGSGGVPLSLSFGFSVGILTK
ncbi:MAG: DUF3575 domain-containing protein [Chitinophagales bacterium]|nr:DUF3575 domain-containing protein [Bacteroidota bacterium]MBP7400166.1 DUF3575 domain-containing protein [Chitinophagales bacterium]MBP8755028.1 DUF3575 domain-containing protein [Chitinophagales bacterium]MBP9190707.1 DUF3575 domain-containing protein [Chitinophagales bacterium]MBP9549452.1 DUF3575 domain-containing protein [Chitinophagales bacterium]